MQRVHIIHRTHIPTVPSIMAAASPVVAVVARSTRSVVMRIIMVRRPVRLAQQSAIQQIRDPVQRPVRSATVRAHINPIPVPRPVTVTRQPVRRVPPRRRSVPDVRPMARALAEHWIRYPVIPVIMSVVQPVRPVPVPTIRHPRKTVHRQTPSQMRQQKTVPRAARPVTVNIKPVPRVPVALDSVPDVRPGARVPQRARPRRVMQTII